MDMQKIMSEAKKIRFSYSQDCGERRWGVPEFLKGFVGDVGNLMRLIRYRKRGHSSEDINKKLGNELSDCLWSLLILSDELGIDIENAFMSNMRELSLVK